MQKHYRVAILGASNKEERYSHQALLLLKQYGHEAFPIHPSLNQIEDVRVYQNLAALPDFHTMTFYVGASRSEEMQEEILKLNFKRAIFNPGSENPKLQSLLEKKGVEVVVGCTLVMLKTNQF